MRRRIPPENTPRVLLVAALFLGVLFAVLPRGYLAPVAIFAAAFALLAYLLDRQLRGWVDAGVARVFAALDWRSERDTQRGRSGAD